MFKIEINKNVTYGEISQPNPMRWRIMRRNKKTLTSQAGIMKCKDFFNDLVAYRKTGKKFSIYGFDNSTVTFNKYGLYMLLTEIQWPEQFIQNVNATLNAKLKEQLQTEVKMYKQGKTSVVVHIPNALWENTYRISLATMVLRLCNYSMTYDCWDDLYKPHAPMNTVDSAFNVKAKAFTKQHGFILPEQYQKYWFYAGANYNPDISDWYCYTTVVHNNGCTNWCTYMENV